MTGNEPQQARYPAGWRAGLPFILMIPLALWFPAQLFENAVELTPDHSNEILTGACYIACFFGVIAFALMLKIKPELRIRPLPGAIMFGLIAGVGAGLLGGAIIDTTQQFIDFSGPDFIQSEQDFSIERAYITRGKGGYDHVVLSAYGADLHASPRDYTKFFNDADDIHPVGYCIHATLQRNGGALRILTPALGSFRTGSISKCSPGKSIMSGPIV